MTKTEKEIIFNLLKTCDTYETGYLKPEYSIIPDFSESNNQFQETIEKPEKTESISVPDQAQNNAISETQNGITLSQLNSKILRCTRCELARTRNNVVPGQGVEHPQVLVVGEAPGYNEDMEGLPFVGKAGALLDKMLAAINLSRTTNCYIANTIKCRPPENRDPTQDEQAACFSFLETQIHLLKPKMILCMGRIAGHKLLKIEEDMSHLHGKIFDYNGIPLMVTYHPSALLRDEKYKRPAWHDLQEFRKKLDEILSTENN